MDADSSKGTYLGPYSGLRKSVSVDSFVNLKQSQDANSYSKTRTGVDLPIVDSVMLGTQNATPSDSRTPQNSRSRGVSVSSSFNSSATSSSDYDSISKPSHNNAKPFNAPTEFVSLTSPTLSTDSTQTSLSVSTNTSTQDSAKHVATSPILQPRPRASTQLMSPAAGRVRSGSLAGYTQSPRAIPLTTQISSIDSRNSHGNVTLVVVGVTGCGKSVVIRKGLKGFGQLDSSSQQPPNSSLCCTRRIIKPADNEHSEPEILTVVEIDISPSSLDISFSEIGLLPDTPRVDGVIICYDASNIMSFQPVEGLLSRYRSMQLPTVVLACKSDMEQQIDPLHALEVIQRYDAGLVEVTTGTDAGKEKMKRSFQWLLKAIRLHRQSTRVENGDYKNPASPDMIRSLPPWEVSGVSTPTIPSTSISQYPRHQPSGLSSRMPMTPTSPTRARSTGDLLSEHEHSKLRDSYVDSSGNTKNEMMHRLGPTLVDIVNGAREAHDDKKDGKKETRPAQWATLDELLDKLIFLAVSGDDPTYITHFLLTYRRFATPRSVLLAMQKRMRQLDNPNGDPMFACFAQMRICNLLELWIRDYPYDFAVRGTAGALSALIKSIISKTYLLHYGSDFLPFLEMLPGLVDRDATWALKADDTAEESDDSYSIMEDDDESMHRSEGSPTGVHASPVSTTSSTKLPPPAMTTGRERKGSLPLTTKSYPVNQSASGSIDHQEFTSKQQLKELQRIAQEVSMIDSEEIAQEITRMEVRLFLDIEPRHWLQYTFVPGKKNPQTDSIARFNDISNQIASWVVSLVLCHDRAKARARQIEKFAEVAQKLRALNNYSALRAVVAGINNSTFPGDLTMEQFKARSPEHAKNLQSWDVLLQHIRAHRAYRLALRNSKGACIPALEVHMSDLIRSHEGNSDINSNDPNKIHWGKFNMMGRFITSTTQCQAQCRASNDYNFPERPHIRELILTPYKMNEEMQTSRISPQEDEHSVPVHPTEGTQRGDPPLLRKIAAFLSPGQT